MAQDRFVRWRREKPTIAKIQPVLEDYLGKDCVVTRDGARLTAVLPGKPSSPFRRLPGYDNIAATQEQREERFLEVFVDGKYADVITRQADPLTNAVADGFAALIQRVWNGKAEP